MSNQYSAVCEHGRVRRQCADCEVINLYKEIDALRKGGPLAKELRVKLAKTRESLEIAIKALEHYAMQTDFDDVAYGREAREALLAIQSAQIRGEKT